MSERNVFKSDAPVVRAVADKGGTIRLTSFAFSDEVVLLPDQVFELSWKDGSVLGRVRRRRLEPQDEQLPVAVAPNPDASPLATAWAAAVARPVATDALTPPNEIFD